MKAKALMICLFVLSLTAINFAQSVTVTPKKIVYKRPKPIDEYKKSFVVIYPKSKPPRPPCQRKLKRQSATKKIPI